jgi:cytoskeletal protein RodZ
MSIGQKLRQAREDRALTLEQAAQATHIRVRYLQALEADDLESLPSKTQARGFLRSYAAYLKLNFDKLLEITDREIPLAEKTYLVDSNEDASLPALDTEIFIEIGQKLRTQREILGLSLEDIEHHIFVRGHYLQALEAGNLAGLPSPVQGRGMLKNYAQFLGMDVDELLVRFADGLQAGLNARRAVQLGSLPVAPLVPVKRISTFRRLFSTDILIGGIMLLILIGFMGWGALQIAELRSDQEPTPTSPSIADILIPLPSPTGSTTAPAPPITTDQVLNSPDINQTPGPENLAQETPESPESETSTPEALIPTFTPTVINDSPLQVYMVVRQRAWVRITVDGEVALQGRVLPGSAYTFSGNERVEVLTGNGAGLLIVFNQLDLGPLGAFGEVVNRIYTLQGVLTPTASSTPFGQPPPTGTLTPAVTPESTSTPTP